MANPGQDAAVRVVLEEAARIDGVTPCDYRVTSVRMARRQNTAIRYYDIVLELVTGTVRRVRVGVNRTWIESW